MKNGLKIIPSYYTILLCDTYNIKFIVDHREINAKKKKELRQRARRETTPAFSWSSRTALSNSSSSPPPQSKVNFHKRSLRFSRPFYALESISLSQNKKKKERRRRRRRKNTERERGKRGEKKWEK